MQRDHFSHELLEKYPHLHPIAKIGSGDVKRARTTDFPPLKLLKDLPPELVFQHINKLKISDLIYLMIKSKPLGDSYRNIFLEALKIVHSFVLKEYHIDIDDLNDLVWMLLLEPNLPSIHFPHWFMLLRKMDDVLLEYQLAAFLKLERTAAILLNQNPELGRMEKSRPDILLFTLRLEGEYKVHAQEYDVELFHWTFVAYTKKVKQGLKKFEKGLKHFLFDHKPERQKNVFLKRVESLDDVFEFLDEYGNTIYPSYVPKQLWYGEEVDLNEKKLQALRKGYTYNHYFDPDREFPKYDKWIPQVIFSNVIFFFRQWPEDMPTLSPEHSESMDEYDFQIEHFTPREMDIIHTLFTFFVNGYVDVDMVAMLFQTPNNAGETWDSDKIKYYFPWLKEEN